MLTATGEKTITLDTLCNTVYFMYVCDLVLDCCTRQMASLSNQGTAKVIADECECALVHQSSQVNLQNNFRASNTSPQLTTFYFSCRGEDRARVSHGASGQEIQ